jgi:hypothetical protein
MRILNGQLLVLTAVVVSAFATSAAPTRHELVERNATSREMQVLLESRSVAEDLSGTFWVHHGVEGIEQERQASAVTALRSDGTTRTYLASDILPAGSVSPGMVGQVYAITPLTSRGLYAATTGWIAPDRSTHNAVVFFREDGDGRISNVSVVPVSGARSVAAGPYDTVILAARDPLKNGDLQLATVLDANGNVMATFGPFEAESIRAASERLAAIRFHQLDANTVAMLDAAEQRVHALRVFAPADCAIPQVAEGKGPRRVQQSPARSRFAFQPLWNLSVAHDGEVGIAESRDVIAFSATANSVTVARQVLVDADPRTIVTQYSRNAKPRSWVSEHIWRAALVGRTNIRGVVSRGTVWEERVELND